MTDSAKAELRGPAKKCETEVDYVYPDHHWVMHTTSAFSRNGALLHQHHRNPNGSAWSIQCHYNEHGRILRKEFLTGGPTLTQTSAEQVHSYHYDALGRLERVVARTRTGAERVCESYVYDAAGRKTLTVYPDPDLRGRNAGVHPEMAFELSIEASSVVTIFDDSERPVKRVFYDPNGMVDRRVLLRYDAAGRLVEEGERDAGGRIREDFRNLYRYDAAGRLIEKVIQHYAFGTHWKSFSYNRQDDIAEERHQRTSGIVDETGNEQWTQRYRYQYDGHDNWIDRVTETTAQGGDARVSMVQRRRIDYY